MTDNWTLVIRGDWYLPHLANMLKDYRGNREQNQCRDEVIAQINGQMVDADGDGVFKTTRPLVVIDPEDRDQVQRLYELLNLGDRHTYWSSVTGVQAALRSLVEPPRPAEPTGLGAVVEDAKGFTWVRTHATGYPWHSNLDRTDPNFTAARKWAEFAAVKVLSEGLTTP